MEGPSLATAWATWFHVAVLELGENKLSTGLPGSIFT